MSPSAEKQEFIRQYRENQLNFSRFYTMVLMDADLTLPQYALLAQLLDQKPCTMTSLSTRLHLSKPAITNLVDRLEEKRFLKRSPHLEDRRIHLIEILPAGTRVVADIQARILQLLLTALESLNEKDRQTITRFYGKLAEVLAAGLTKMRAKK